MHSLRLNAIHVSNKVRDDGPVVRMNIFGYKLFCDNPEAMDSNPGLVKLLSSTLEQKILFNTITKTEN